MKSSNVRLIITAVVLVAAAFALIPTFQANGLADERSVLRTELDRSRSRWLKSKNTADSLSYLQDSLALHTWDSTNGTNYREETANFLAKPIKLGLDLQGGIYITMEIDIATLIEESASKDALDETFQQVMAATREELATSDDAILDIFIENFNKIARPHGKTLINYFDFDLGENASDEGIRSKLAENIDQAVKQASEIIRRRIDQYGVVEPTIQATGRRIVVELPGVDDESQVRNLLSTTAQLEFKLVRNDPASLRLFQKLDKTLAGKIKDSTDNVAGDSTAADSARSDSARTDSTRADSARTDSTSTDSTGKDSTRSDSARTDSARADSASDTSANPYEGLPEAEQRSRYLSDHPFTSWIISARYQPEADAEGQNLQAIGMLPEASIPTSGEFSYYTTKEGVRRMKALLERPDVQAAIPDSLEVAFSAHPEFYGEEGNEETAVYGVYVLKRTAEMTGQYVTDARPGFDPQGRVMVEMAMGDIGADQWARITGENIKKRVAIVLDGAVYSAPTVQNKISGGNSQITGSKDAEEANLLSIVLRAGALKAPIRIIEERLVGPSLGEDSIRQGTISTLVATLIVFIFMGIYYRFAGLVANVALLFNILITLAILAAFGATLTLPGIGGLVLTIGMAVDGNILIYERIREELAAGRSLKAAIKAGYEKAWSAVLDTHITTMISGAILYFAGSGPIQGFALTLMVGLSATLFTSVYVTRTIFMWMIERGTTSIDFGQPKTALVQPAAEPTLASRS